MAQRRSHYNRTASHSSATTTIIQNNSIELEEEKSHPIQSLSESLPPIIPTTLNDLPSMTESSQTSNKINHNNNNHPTINNINNINNNEPISKINNNNNISSINSPELQEVRIFEPGYQQWQGTNKVCCKGRIIGGPEILKLITTVVIIVVPTLLYLSCTARILWQDYNSVSGMIGGLILSLLCITFLIITAEMD
eukprot:963188_1